MTPRKSTGPETDAEKIVEAVDRLRTAVDQRLEILGDELSRISDECRWVCNELRGLFGKKAVSRPQEIHETVTCASCDDESASLADAVTEGWRDLLPAPDGPSWTFLGQCPSCQEKSMIGNASAPVSKEIESESTGQERLEYLLSCSECEAEASLTDGLLNGWTGVSAHEDGFVGRCPEHEAEHGPSAVEPRKVLQTPAKSSAGAAPANISPRTAPVKPKSLFE